MLKNINRLVRYVFITILIIIVICGIYIKSSNILHIVDKIYSPDMLVKQVVYVNKSNDSNKDSITIKVYKDNRYDTSISFSGRYDGIFWTTDNSKYIIKAKEYINNIYVVDKNSGEITGIDTGLDLALQDYIKNNTDIINFTFDEKSNANYEFIQWEKDNETMLIYYEIDDLAKNIHSGYFLYNFKDNKIMGILSSNQ